MKKFLIGLMTATIVLSSTIISFAGDWKQTGYGWWYDNGNGSYTANNWQNINNTWYYFNQDGYMRTGWIIVNGKWYYCHANGEMAHDTWVDGKYYVGADGVMYVNTTTPDGHKVDGSGLKLNESIINSKKYIGTYRTELGHTGGGSQEFTMTIKKIEDNKIWGAFSYGGVTDPGYGEWNGMPIINNKVQGTFYYALAIWNDGVPVDTEFNKEEFCLYLDSDSPYFDLNYVTSGKKTKLVIEDEYDGYYAQEYRNWLVEGNKK